MLHAVKWDYFVVGYVIADCALLDIPVGHICCAG